jgi:hypothetical protein
MKLYKYLPPARADVLERASIRFTQPVYFNDPFEFSPTIGALVAPSDEGAFIESALSEALSDKEAFAQRFYAALEEHAPFPPPEVRTVVTPEIGLALIEPELRPMFEEFIRQATHSLNERWRPETREQVGRKVGVLSLTELPDNLLMWAHYAESHKGFVVGFDAEHPYFDARKHPDDMIRHLAPVVYTVDRPAAVLLNPSVAEQEHAQRFASSFFLTKSVDWQYEREWRMLRSVDEASDRFDVNGEEVCLFAFPPDAITDVIVGCRMPNDGRARLTALRSDSRYAHVQWSEACVHSEQFRVTINPMQG